MFVDKIGVIISKDAWLALLEAETIVGCDVLTLNDDSLEVFTRFSGLDHGNFKSWELGITGNPKNAKHAGLHGRHEIFTSRVEAEIAHAKAVADVKKAGGVAEATVIVGP